MSDLQPSKTGGLPDPLAGYVGKPVISQVSNPGATYVGRVIVELWQVPGMTAAQSCAFTADPAAGEASSLLTSASAALATRLSSIPLSSFGNTTAP
jgi:hypothetical protein